MKFKSLENMFFLILILIILIDINSKTKKAKRQITKDGFKIVSTCDKYVAKKDTINPNPKLPESPMNCLVKIPKLKKRKIIK